MKTEDIYLITALLGLGRKYTQEIRAIIPILCNTGPPSATLAQHYKIICWEDIANDKYQHVQPVRNVFIGLCSYSDDDYIIINSLFAI